MDAKWRLYWYLWLSDTQNKLKTCDLLSDLHYHSSLLNSLGKT